MHLWVYNFKSGPHRSLYKSSRNFFEHYACQVLNGINCLIALILSLGYAQKWQFINLFLALVSDAEYNKTSF